MAARPGRGDGPTVVVAGSWEAVRAWCVSNDVDVRKVVAVTSDDAATRVMGMLPGKVVYAHGWRTLHASTIEHVQYRAERAEAVIVHAG